MVPKCLGELQAYLDKHPIRFNIVVVILLLPAISAGTLLRAVVSAVVTRQGLVLSATFVAIRIVAEWLGNLYTFFWYVQTSAVSKLEGAGSWSSAGSFLVLGSVASLILGLLTMLVMMALAEPLLQLFSPASVEDTSIMVSIGMMAHLVIATVVPARVCISNFSGVGLAQSGSNLVLIVAIYLALFLAISAAVAIQVGVMNGSGCEQEIVEANLTAHQAAQANGWNSSAPIFDPETWVCSSAEDVLASTALVESVSEWIGAAVVCLLTFYIGKKRGYFIPHGCSLKRYATDKDAAAVAYDAFRSHAGVAVRSILFNTMDMISPAISLGIGVTEAAVFNFFAEMGFISYTVPNLISAGAMILGPRLLGQGRIDEFRKLVHLHRWMALFFGVVFTVIAYLTSEVSVADEFTNKVDGSLFTPLADAVYPAAIVLQPFLAMIGVYGPLLVACQGYVSWGILVAVLFFLVYLPPTLAAAVLGDVHLLVYAQLAFAILHFVGVYYLVHFRFLPALCVTDSVTHAAVQDEDPKADERAADVPETRPPRSFTRWCSLCF